MLYAAFRDPNGNPHTNIYYSFEDFHRETFSPENEIIGLVEFRTHGKTYADRKESTRETAIMFQSIDSDMSGGLSWGELADVSAWFETMAKRYGLVEEFRENGII